jgi:hypothetical protein
VGLVLIALVPFPPATVTAELLWSTLLCEGRFKSRGHEGQPIIHLLRILNFPKIGKIGILFTPHFGIKHANTWYPYHCTWSKVRTDESGGYTGRCLTKEAGDWEELP